MNPVQRRIASRALIFTGLAVLAMPAMSILRQPTSGAVPANAIKNMLGVADWNSNYSGSVSNLLQGAQDSETIGVQNLMIAMGPNYKTADYTNLGVGTMSNLKQLAQSKSFQAVFNMPFTTYAIDASPISIPDPLNPPDPSTEYKTIYKEYYDFILYMLKTYQGTGKTFILKNWEGDNEFYYENLAASHPTAAQQIANMRVELQARNDALVQAKKDAAVSGVTIKDAIEFNTVNCQRTGKSPCMLTDVIPYVQSDMLSYSSYETINAGVTNNDEANTITSDINYVRNLPGVNQRPLMIGEFGFPQDWQGAQSAATMTQTAITAFEQAGIPYAFDWQIKDSGPTGGGDASMGLINADGTLSPSWHVINQAVDTPIVTPAHPIPVSIVNRIPITSGQRPSGKINSVISAAPNEYLPLQQNTLNQVQLPANPTMEDVQTAIINSGIHPASR